MSANRYLWAVQWAKLAAATAIVVVVFSTACRADPAPIDVPASAASPVEQRAEPSPAPTTGGPTPTPTGEPTGEPSTDEAAVAVQPTAAPADDPPLVLELPDAFIAPEGWADPMPIDERIIESTLPNGLRYLIQQNDAPGGQAQLRLVVRAGSVNESISGSGVAHFLEHMMFNGTDRFPDNKIINVLEGFGSSFGPDVNAYTSFEETVYELTVPARTSASLQLGLDVLEQWASSATLDPEAVIAERGVVREELRRSQESVGGRVGNELRAVLLEDTSYLHRDPIGVADSIERMTSRDLAEFYETWYRPDLMTVIAVGDFDPRDMERRIGATFGELASSRSTELPTKDVAVGPLAEPVFDVYTDPELHRTQIEIFWRIDEPPVTSRLGARHALTRAVTMMMIDERLREIVQSSGSVFIAAGASHTELAPSLAAVSVVGRADAADIGAGLEELLVEAERARQHGFSSSEFERAVQRIRTSVEQSFAESSTRQDDTIAASLVSYAVTGEVALGVDDALEIGFAMLDSLAPADAQLFVHELLLSEPYVVVLAPAELASKLLGPEEISARYKMIHGSAIEAGLDLVNTPTELMSAPDPGAVIDERFVSPLDTTVVTFENGVRMAFRETTITKNFVQFEAASEGGFFAVDGPEVPLLGFASAIVVGSGFTSLDAVMVDRLLSDSLSSLEASVERAQESLVGSTASGDLETLFQLIHLQMTEPTISDAKLRQFEQSWRPLALNPDSSPSLAAELELWSLRYGSSPWFRRAPTVADLDAFDRELLLDAWRQRFANAADFVFVFVGDFDPDELVNLGARYLGTLPASENRETAIDRDPGLPEENLVSTVFSGVGDQGQLIFNWESPYELTLDTQVAAEVLELVVNARLRDLIREELGASYAPRANVVVLDLPKPWIDSTIDVGGDPDRLEELSAAVRAELARLREGDIDQSYLDRAVDQLAEGDRFFSNQEWLDLIKVHLSNPDRPSDEYLRRTDIARALDLEDLAEAARAAFPATRSVEVRLVPAP